MNEVRNVIDDEMGGSHVVRVQGCWKDNLPGVTKFEFVCLPMAPERIGSGVWPSVGV